MIRSYRGQRPVLGPGTYVDPSAQIVGDVSLGADSSVWMNAVVRGDVYPIRIGDSTNVQDGAVLHVTAQRNDLAIGDLVTIGHRAVVHGCRVDSRVLIGMGAVVLDRAVVESDSIVAAGSVVVEGTRVPAGSMVAGVPARVKRRLTEEEIEAIVRSARRYVGYKNQYLEEEPPRGP